MKRRTSSRSLVRQPHDRHPPRPAQCGKAIRKRSAIVSFTALPLVDAPRGRETPKGYFRPDLEQTAADEGDRTLLPAPHALSTDPRRFARLNPRAAPRRNAMCRNNR